MASKADEILSIRSALCIMHQAGDQWVPAGRVHPFTMQGLPVWCEASFSGSAGSAYLGKADPAVGSVDIGSSLPFVIVLGLEKRSDLRA
jgi:hypothetical protein